MMQKPQYLRLKEQVELRHQQRVAASETIRDDELAAIELVCQVSETHLCKTGSQGTGVAAIKDAISHMSGTFTRAEIAKELEMAAPMLLAHHPENYLSGVLSRLLKAGRIDTVQKGWGRRLSVYRQVQPSVEPALEEPNP